MGGTRLWVGGGLYVRLLREVSHQAGFTCMLGTHTNRLTPTSVGSRCKETGGARHQLLSRPESDHVRSQWHGFVVCRELLFLAHSMDYGQCFYVLCHMGV